MSTIDVTLPKDSTLPHAATQVRVFDRNRTTLLGSAIHDRTTVNYVEGGKVLRGKPTVDVVTGAALIGLDGYVSQDQLDGLYYPVLAVPS